MSDGWCLCASAALPGLPCVASVGLAVWHGDGVLAVPVACTGGLQSQVSRIVTAICRQQTEHQWLFVSQPA